MNYKKILEKPFRLMAIIGFVYLLSTVLLNMFTGFYAIQDLMPFSKTVFYAGTSVSMVLCVITFFFYRNHYFYYAALEILVLTNLYSGKIYTALFLSSILFILLLVENKFSSRIWVIAYLAVEILKISVVIPYGAKKFFEYAGITLFSLCTIGCINLLFRHAYGKRDSSTISLNDYKFSERQKDCIKKIVVDNTTIKALAIDHNVSESAIKKDLSHIYTVLGITGKADLKALFMGCKFD